MNYSDYKFKIKELLIHISGFIFIALLVSKLFYGKYILAICAVLIYWPVTKRRKHMLVDKRKKELKIQFNDAMISLADLMSVGFSVENAIAEVHSEMEVLYGKESYICRELTEIANKVSVNTPIEVALSDFASRTKVDDIILFSQSFRIAKRTGGNIQALIQLVSEHISQSIRVEQEIEVALSEKKMEMKIMALVPIGIILYVNVTSPGFLDVMYTTVLGRIIMTLSLIIYGVTIFVAGRIQEVEM